MSDELKDLVIRSGAPEEVMNDLWFNIFCQQFAHNLLTLAEEEVFKEVI